MTNSQIAHHNGMDKAPHNWYEYRDAMVRVGLTITDENKTIFGRTYCEAEKDTPRGKLHVICGQNGTARINKPNGARKWVYERTPNQLADQLNKILDFYR